ncbi:microfibril-associated glycoprotein 4-like [Anopheles funestus]|uniref:microfibril-associated glycoprotein 4-like n=1 Tax=Anopheles funestus TaxID=62324 RepID=UPI0020C6D235|nr:microfibril-associated glycoprotein 4-like [Anopheles funestus]
MSIWCFVLLSVIVGVMANDSPAPNNQPVPSTDITTSPEFRILERIERLSQTLSDKIKTVNDRVDKMVGKFSEQMHNVSTATTQRLINLEHKLERVPEDTGVYFMKPDMAKNITFEVSRDWTNNHGFGGNWIVFQRRFNGSVDFYRNWNEYKDGFGNLRGEHWLGLEKLYSILKTRQHELLIVLEDFDGVIAYAHYDDFKIGDESEKYMIKSVGQYNGTAGDSFSYHKDGLFTTFDQNNDKATYNCAQAYAGAWWFKSCYNSHLNGEYLHGKSNRHAGIIWFKFRGLSHSLKRTKMMVKPVGT